jgi:two-component system CheB/CheR fusion protein
MSSSKPSGPRKPASGESGEAGDKNFYIVGIGASAGGLEALEEFMDHVPPDTGMAFVIVFHMKPGQSILLPELLGKHSDLPVEEAEQGVELEPNHVYVCPPGVRLQITNSRFTVIQINSYEKPSLPIDSFFRSLAENLGERAVCIVLSGTGTDGILGPRAVKEKSGMVLVQELESARYTGMPRSAIDTGLADYIQQPGRMPEQLVSSLRRISLERRAAT